MGEIGKALTAVLKSGGLLVDGKDKEPMPKQWASYEVIHICIPFSTGFVDICKGYVQEYGAQDCLIVVHSTVPIGTTRLLGENAVHSPVRGVHPDLEAGIRTFVKYMGGKRAQEVSDLFSVLGIQTRIDPKPETTEALKLWDTTAYGFNIVLQKAIKEDCDERGLDFDMVYTDANRSYNAGYTALGRPEFSKYILKHVPGRIGGHCIIPNAELLGGWVGDMICQLDDEMFVEEMRK